MQFDVRALSAENMMIQLTIDAPDEADARRQLEARGLAAATIRNAQSAAKGVTQIRKGGRQRFSAVLFSQELLALLKAGLSIVEALEALLEKEANEGTRSILQRQLTGLREGKRFSSVLSEQANLFSALYIGMVKAAEGTSDLPRALDRFIQYQNQVDLVRNKVISSAIYPLILLMVGGGVSLFLIGYVVPRFADVYQGAGRSMPWMSQLLLNWGLFYSHHTAAVLAAIAAIFGALFLAYRNLSGSAGKANWIARLPGIGERLRIYELARLYRTLGMLNEGGIPIVAAMQMIDGMVSDSTKANVQSTIKMVESGSQLSSALESCGLTTPISLRMLRVGERTGEMGSMLSQSAAFYDDEISRWVDRFTRALEPILMAAIGGIVGVIVVLLYMPIFDLAGSIS